MSDDQPLESRRELENLRQRYQEHRRSIRHLLQTAPDERLAEKYEETLTELQRAIDQLDRVDRQPFGGAAAPAAAAVPPNEQFDPNRTRSIRPGSNEIGSETVAAKPNSGKFDEAELSGTSRPWDDPVVTDKSETTNRNESSSSSSALPWILGFIILAAIAIGIYLAWPDSDEAGDDVAPVSETAAVEEPPVEEPVAPRSLVAEPSSYDYGVIAKGTRSVHRFALKNQTDAAMAITVSRSDCRCLWYDYPGEIPPGGSIDLAITVDGARAPAGTLAETVTISSESAPDAVVEIELVAQIQER